MWIGLDLQLDAFFMPRATDVCVLTKGLINPQGYSCVNPNTGSSFPPNAATNAEIQLGHGDEVQGGITFGNVRLLGTFDYALNQNTMLGARAGYVFRTGPPNRPFPPLHLEARFTYLFGRDALGQVGAIIPMAFVGAGLGEFDAYVPVTVFQSNGPSNIPANAWLTAGPVFASVGAGARFSLGATTALTAAMRLEGAFGGSSHLLPGLAPEAGFHYGF